MVPNLFYNLTYLTYLLGYIKSIFLLQKYSTLDESSLKQVKIKLYLFYAKMFESFVGADARLPIGFDLFGW